jgi:ribonuclease Z
MSLAEDILGGLRGYSKAMYSTWFFHRPAHLLFDAGEGAASSLGNFVYAVENVFISHGHYDHVGGLPGLVLARNAAMGERTKPLAVYHPAGDALVQLEREYVTMLSRQLDFELSWNPLRDGDTVPLGAGSGHWRVQAFATRHTRSYLTLGFKLVETRTRLKAELNGLSEKEIGRVAREKGREAVRESYDHCLLAYSGDSMALDPAQVRGATVLLHEATFLDADERKAKFHPTLEEVLETAVRASIGGLGIFHVSSRYTRADLEARVTEQVRASGLDVPVFLFHQHRQIRIR